jgi:hypothetical protein
MKTKEKKLFTKTELKRFGEFCRDEGKQQTLKDELEFLRKWVKMGGHLIDLSNRIAQIEKELGLKR